MAHPEDDPKAVELLALDAGEVSLVDKPAIKRRFFRIKSEVEGPVVGYQKLPLADKDEEWTWTEEVQKNVRGSDAWDRFRSAHIWHEPPAGDESAGTFKLPIAKDVDGTLKVVWKAVEKAMESLNGPDSGIPDEDRKRAYNHLVRYYRRFGEKAPAFVTSTVEKNEEVQETAGPVEKAVVPVLNALIDGYLSVVSQDAEAFRQKIEQGTLTKQDAYSLLWEIHSAAYKAEENVQFVAKALGVEITEKADRKMTRRRRYDLKAAIEALKTLAAELEDEMADESKKTETKETAKNDAAEPTVEVQIEKALEKFGEALLVKVDERIAAAVKPVEKAEETKVEAKTSETAKDEKQIDVAKALEAGFTKLLEVVDQRVEKAKTEVSKRVDALSTGSKSKPNDSTTDVEVEKAEKNIWGGIFNGHT